LLIRQRRKTLGISQSDLSEAIGVSFQQVQKYERGANRVSASTLYRIAIALNCTPADFFAGLPLLEGSAEDPLGLGEVGREFFAEDGGIDLARAYVRLPPVLRRALVASAKAMAKAD
jgi:transcriptional regulator with XRE-family HTH domain